MARIDYKRAHQLILDLQQCLREHEQISSGCSDEDIELYQEDLNQLEPLLTEAISMITWCQLQSFDAGQKTD